MHGHFYQPPREHPWLGVVEPQRSAAPARDWNARITAECYAPNAAARVLDGHGRLRDVVNNYAWTSFNFGPTLLGWLARHAPAVVDALRRADDASRARTGHGNAWAQAYGHAILPLSTPRDVQTQVLWGRRDFEHRFGRLPEGMWLPEMAVDRTALAALAEAGITLTMLAPHQARRIRPLGAGDDTWSPVEPATLDIRRVYRWLDPSGRAVDIVFRDEGLSHDVAFGGLLADGATLTGRLREVLAAAGEEGIVTVAVDGETYGHHQRFGEMGLAFALQALAAEEGVALVGPAAFRARHPAAHEVEIADRTSWSCPHGVERWRADCGCRLGPPSSQAWRAPLRQAIDWLRDELDRLYEVRAGETLRDPWGARDRYVDCLLDPARTARFLADEGRGSLSPAATVEARRAVELARHALLMQTSCGWFFDELSGIEPVQNLRYAARAIELARSLGCELEEDFLARLVAARSNHRDHESGADLYRQAARGVAATPARVAATGALLAVVGSPPDVPGYELRLPAWPADGRLVGEVAVTELSTGAVSAVRVEAERPASGAPTCRADGERFGFHALFGTQREGLLAALASEAGAIDEACRRAALERVGPTLEPLLASGEVLSPALADLLGREGAARIMAGLEHGARLTALVAETETLRARGVVFPGALAGRLAMALEARASGLPGAAADMLLLLDLAGATGLHVDLGPTQLRAFVRLRESRGADEAVAVLRERLGLAPEER